MPDALTSALTRYYDAVPYDSHPFPQTAMEHLEALAFLFGLDAPPPSQARVLELGCASGGNLIPFAARHPQARALGLDLSPVQIAQGHAHIAQVGLKNVELRVFDIASIDASFGEFDYIVCHGVYSWVPGAVQDAILRVCSEHLAPNGVAYVSYNTYPGWKAREIVRDAMILRGGPRDTPGEKLAYARGMLEFLDQSARADSVLKKTLEETLPIVRDGNSAYLLHEFLEPCNAPCYFKEFVERAQAHGLAYLADAEPATMFVQNYGDKVREPLLRECGGSQVLMEQYLDFLVNRTFRQTLLVKAARATDIRYRLDASRLRALEFAGVFSPADGGAIRLDGPAQPCTAMRDLKVILQHRWQRAVAQVLDARYPASVPFDDMVAAATAHADGLRDGTEANVLAMLEELLIMGAVRIRRSPTGLASQVSSAPRASDALRRSPGLALAAGQDAAVCNVWHERTPLSVLERCLLPWLDGEHDHDALLAHLSALVRDGTLHLLRDGAPLAQDSPDAAAMLRQQLQDALRDLQRKGLLIA